MAELKNIFMTKTEIKTIFKNYLVLLVDSNEQKSHIEEYFNEKNIRTLRYNMKSADISFLILPNHITGNNILFFGKSFLIERKSGKKEQGGGFAELRNNLIKEHTRFKDEFKRLEKVDKVYLLLENTESLNDIKLVPDRKIKTETFIKTFKTFMINRNKERAELDKQPIDVIFSDLERAGETVMLLIFDYLKDIEF